MSKLSPEEQLEDITEHTSLSKPHSCDFTDEAKIKKWRAARDKFLGTYAHKKGDFDGNCWTVQKSFDLGSANEDQIVGKGNLNAGEVSTPLDYNLYVLYGPGGKGTHYFRLVQDCQDADLFKADKTFRWRNQYGGWKYEPFFKNTEAN